MKVIVHVVTELKTVQKQQFDGVEWYSVVSGV
jgi:hypothetical protein